jgi:hypothetical protein
MLLIDPRQNHHCSWVDYNFLDCRGTAIEGPNSTNHVKSFPLKQKFIIARQGKFSIFPKNGEGSRVILAEWIPPNLEINLPEFVLGGAGNLPKESVGVKITRRFFLSSEDVFLKRSVEETLVRLMRIF